MINQCAGNSSEVCGGSNRLNVYSLAGTNVTTAAPPSLTSVSKAVTTLAAGWAYKGCYIDNVAGRILRQGEFDEDTVESCVAECVSLGLSVAGIEVILLKTTLWLSYQILMIRQYGGQCFCDNEIVNGGNKTTDSACAMECTGNSAEICGGPNLMSKFPFLYPSRD